VNQQSQESGRESQILFISLSEDALYVAAFAEKTVVRCRKDGNDNCPISHERCAVVGVFRGIFLAGEVERKREADDGFGGHVFRGRKKGGDRGERKGGRQKEEWYTAFRFRDRFVG